MNINDTLYGALTGFKIESSIKVADGIFIEPTYAHVMAPFVVAFALPTENSFHPGPWEAADGGLALDTHAQITANVDISDLGFDGINTIWWVIALLRLKASPSIRVPVVSNQSFSLPRESNDKATIRIIEPPINSAVFTNPSFSHKSQEIDLDWIVENCKGGADLMSNHNFNLAFQCLDSAHHANSYSIALTLMWSALEALFRPGRSHVTKILAKRISTYLEAETSDQDRLFAEVKSLYSERGMVVHSANKASNEIAMRSWQIAKKCFEKSIEKKELPDGAMLDSIWQLNHQ